MFIKGKLKNQWLINILQSYRNKEHIMQVIENGKQTAAILICKINLQKSKIEFIEHNELFENSPSNFLEKLKTNNSKSINSNETVDSDKALQVWKNIWEKPHITTTNSLWMPIIKEKYENIPEQV